MANRTTSRDDTAAADMAGGGQSALTNYARQQLASGANTTSSMLRALDVFQQAQQQMMQRAALMHSQTAERLRTANTPAELMAVQSTFLLTGVSELTQYGQQLMLAAMKAQGEFMQPAESAQNNGASANPVAPLFQAWQSAFAATMNNAMNGANAASRPH